LSFKLSKLLLFINEHCTLRFCTIYNSYIQGCGAGVVRSRIPNNTGSRSRIFLSESDSGCPSGQVSGQVAFFSNVVLWWNWSFHFFIDTSLTSWTVTCYLCHVGHGRCHDLRKTNEKSKGWLQSIYVQF